MLGIRINYELFECYSVRKDDCRPQFSLKFSQLKLVSQCIWEYVMPSDSQEFIEVSLQNQGKICSKNASSAFSIHGMWRRIDTCLECSYCKTMNKFMKNYRWKHPFIYDTFEYSQKWYFGLNDLKKCKYGRSIAFAGDSVTKKGFLVSAKKFKIPIDAIDLYDIFAIGSKRQNQKSRSQIQLIKDKKKFSALVFGSGRHDLVENSIEEYMVHLKIHIFPILKRLNDFGTKIVWILTAAPRHREPASSRERLQEKIKSVTDKSERAGFFAEISSSNHSCIKGGLSKKESCFHGVDSCSKYPQRWDRIIELNYQLGLFFKDYEWINVFDSFQITNSGVWEWFDDNVHHHMGASGMGDMVFQYILNLICNL